MEKTIIDSLEYNSTRPDLKLMEYGRNVQKIVETICEVPDKAKRTQMCYTLIKLLKQLNPSVKANQDNPQRIWDHLHFLSDYKLDVDGPYPAPTPETMYSKPERVGYNQTDLKFRQYGKHILMMVEKAKEIEDEEEKKHAFIKIGKQMKIFFISWANKDISNDAVILDHLHQMAGGAIDLTEDFKNNPLIFDSAGAAMAKSEQYQQLQKQQHLPSKKRKRKRKK